MNAEALELLKHSVRRFNTWKALQVGPVDLDGAPLAGMSIPGADFAGVSLKDADLTDADLSGANLEGAVLYRANGSGANLSRCKLNEVYAAEAKFDGANLTQILANNTNFSRASLAGACLDHAKLLDVTFDEARMEGASLVGALIVRTPLPTESVDLKEAVIEKSQNKVTVSSVDFRFVGEDAHTFAIGQWTPRPNLSDDQVSSFVLNLRKLNRGDADTIGSFAKLITRLVKSHHRLSACEVVTCVPPSKTDTTEYPVRNLCQMVAKLSGLRDGSGWLVRHRSVLPGGFMGIFGNAGGAEGKHLDSVRVAHPDVVQNRVILIIDDFIDSGSSFRACRHLLLAAGAKKVFCVALARRLQADTENS
jgi:uncharacterized protein YjbI with pentapeptide repeats